MRFGNSKKGVNFQNVQRRVGPGQVTGRKLIDRVKLRHCSNLWWQYNLYVVEQQGVLCEVKW